MCQLTKVRLVAAATYLPKGYLVAIATYLRCASVRQASVAASLRFADSAQFWLRPVSQTRLSFQFSAWGPFGRRGDQTVQSVGLGAIYSKIFSSIGSPMGMP